MTIRYVAVASDWVGAVRAGGPDAYGNPAERAISDGQGNPCRHCLDQIPAGRTMLVLAHRPFAALQPYAETGPIYLCGDNCRRHEGRSVPTVLTTSSDYLLKAYDGNERIIYGTGRVVARGDLAGYAESLLQDPGVAFVDVRSSRNNCFQLRICRSD